MASRGEEGWPSREELRALQALPGLLATVAGGLEEVLDLEPPTVRVCTWPYFQSERPMILASPLKEV